MPERAIEAVGFTRIRFRSKSDWRTLQLAIVSVLIDLIQWSSKVRALFCTCCRGRRRKDHKLGKQRYCARYLKQILRSSCSDSLLLVSGIPFTVYFISVTFNRIPARGVVHVIKRALRSENVARPKRYPRVDQSNSPK